MHMKRNYLSFAVKAALLLPALGLVTSSIEQGSDDGVEVIEVRGIVSSLKRAMLDKKEAVIVSDGIAAEDLGKFPDLNVTEFLQRITGVSIDRDGGEAQQVSVRGLAPQYNAVLVNGRQLATDSAGREFSFDVLAADQITGAQVYKSTSTGFQEGGIGATIQVTTVRPFDFDGFQAAGSEKGVNETLFEEMPITLDGFVSAFEVGSFATDLASWFEPERVDEVEVDAATNTAVYFTQEIGLQSGSRAPATDFVSHTRNSRDVTNDGFGLNVEWAVNDQLEAVFDLSTSSAENDRAGRDRFNVIGIINKYSYDGRGSIPTVAHDGFTNGSLPDVNLARFHYNEKGNRFSDEDEVTEVKTDVKYTPDNENWTEMRFGVYRQEREKSSFQKFDNAGFAFCGYGEPGPAGLVVPFTVKNYFPGLISTFYTYDGDAYFDYISSQGVDFVPTLQNNGYTINGDITSLYADFDLVYDLGDMPLSVNFGARYSETSIDVLAVQSSEDDVVPTSNLTLFSNVLGSPSEFTQGGSYSNLLPSLNMKLEVADDKILRFSVYDSLIRPTMSELSLATIFNEPRRQNFTASGGNPNLEPIKSKNWDLSFEWY